jgi:ribonucleotide reductase class II
LEIIGSNFLCNLSEVHLNQLDPFNLEEQDTAFYAGGLLVSTLLQHQFAEPLYQYSRDLDPIVGVSFTGWFDFCVNALGAKWLQWFADGRPDFYPQPIVEQNVQKISQLLDIYVDNYELVDESGWNFGTLYRDIETAYLVRWRKTVETTVRDYCDQHGLKCPNRCNTIQPSGSKALLTGASPGWHPPKAQWFIRRITIGKNNPIALAAIEYGYTVVPAQSDKDENGQLLDDPFDERCTEWLIEIPTAVSWANLPGVEKIDISQFSATAQLDYYLNVQKNYTTHNTSATIEVREHEVADLAKAIFDAIQNDEGYVSAAILARFDEYETFPRMPFQPITRETYDCLCQEVEARRTCDDFYKALSRYTSPEEVEGPAACDSDKCLIPLSEPQT